MQTFDQWLDKVERIVWDQTGANVPDAYTGELIESFHASGSASEAAQSVIVSLYPASAS